MACIEKSWVRNSNVVTLNNIMRGFKNRESELIWEAYRNGRFPTSQDEFDVGNPNEGDDMGNWDDSSTDEYVNSQPEEDEGVSVMSFEPIDEVDSFEGCNEVIYSDIKKLAEYSNRILEICKETELEPWMQAKLVKASDYVSDIWHRIDAEADFANSGFEQSDNLSL